MNVPNRKNSFYDTIYIIIKHKIALSNYLKWSLFSLLLILNFLE
jgi:hypothetical protein